jgi:hypothetical protein
VDVLSVFGDGDFWDIDLSRFVDDAVVVVVDCKEATVVNGVCMLLLV